MLKQVQNYGNSVMKKNIEQYLDSLPRYHRKPGLSRIQHFIKKNNCYPYSYTVIVGGTNGKGSVVTMLENILHQAGLTVGSMKSPHVYDPTERFSADCVNIAPSLLSEILEFVNRFYENCVINPTLADVLTASALLYFTKYIKPEVLLLEVGMGGDLDPVNAIKRDISVITCIGHDHSNVLGRYPDEIAERKGGIIKKNVPFVTGESNPGALEVFREICDREKAPLIKASPCKLLNIGYNGTTVSSGDFIFTTGIPGIQQASNASLALEVVRIMGGSFKISKESIIKGMNKAKLPWRMEIFREKPAIVFDGAHNRESWENLAESLKYFPHRNLHIIATIQRAKDPDDFPSSFPGQKVILYLPDAGSKKYHTPQYLKKSLDSFEGEVKICENLESALSDSLKNAGSQDIVLSTGTFRLAGYVRELVNMS
jgi:dihydrofolate synthase / folylpolyglutamate synthase